MLFMIQNMLRNKSFISISFFIKQFGATLNYNFGEYLFFQSSQARISHIKNSCFFDWVT